MNATTMTARVRQRPLGVATALATMAGAVALWLLLLQAPRARAAEIVPSVGFTRPVHDGTTKTSVGLALRGSLAGPVLKSEIGVSYRNEERTDSSLRLHMWPITASLIVAPVPLLYGSAGVGWYHTTLEDRDNPAAADETKEQFGTHIGGGLRVPLAAAAAVDLSGRYVHLQEQESRLIPQRFDPSFWTLSLGLALAF